MIKKIVYFILAFLITAQIPLIAVVRNNKAQSMLCYCEPELQQCLFKMSKIPEIRSLITKVQEEGPINIRTNSHQLAERFGAFWDMDRRSICVNLNSQSTEGEVIGSILFELHNAEANSKLQYLDYLAVQGAISREKYVESVEHIEYENSLKASKIVKKGIELGIFSKDAFLPTYATFEEHYETQKEGGHSAWIAKNYDQLARR